MKFRIKYKARKGQYYPQYKILFFWKCFTEKTGKRFNCDTETGHTWYTDIMGPVERLTKEEAEECIKGYIFNKKEKRKLKEKLKKKQKDKIFPFEAVE
jgi:hypothetical protein